MGLHRELWRQIASEKGAGSWAVSSTPPARAAYCTGRLDEREEYLNDRGYGGTMDRAVCYPCSDGHPLPRDATWVK